MQAELLETSTIGKLLSGEEWSVPPKASVGPYSGEHLFGHRDGRQEGRQLLRRLACEWPGATIVATGCYAQLKPEEVAAIKGVDMVLGSNEKLLITRYLDRWLAERRQLVEVTPFPEIKEFRPSCERGDRTRYFLKVQDGCDYFCTYCTIPYARGRLPFRQNRRHRSHRSRGRIRGAKEIVITGVNIGDFGRDSGERLIDLLKVLDTVEGSGTLSHLIDRAQSAFGGNDPMDC